jgi:GntR family transcriptional repressor for pyruvate dehydrogenase complex
VRPPATRRPAPPAPFEGVPIARTDVFTQVLDRLEAWVESAELAPGDRLPSEREIARTLGVSRGSVRQAIKVLTSASRVEQRHGSGTYLTSRMRDPAASLLAAEHAEDPAFLRELAELRAALEVLAVDLASSAAGPSDLARLRVFLERREVELLEEPAAPGSLDVRFEALIAEIAGNALLRRLQSAIHDLHLHGWAKRGRAPASAATLHAEHLAILDAMDAQAWDEAKRLMHHHVCRADLLKQDTS